MITSKHASKLSLPQLNPGVSSVLQYLVLKFPNISADVWQQRMQQGKVHWHDGALIHPDTAYRPQQRVYYYRELEHEPSIPFEEKILFQDEHLLLAYKPHFLPVTPGGVYINECLQNRLRDKTGITSLQALHRLDRATAGLVLLSKRLDTRHAYHHLFETRQIHKTYQAIASINNGSDLVGKNWMVKNCIQRSTPTFLMALGTGKHNSHSTIKCIEQSTNKALFELNPVTGKTHQLRLHMQSIGMPILNDPYYPVLQEKKADNYSQPLQLLAKKLSFIDPISQQHRSFSCAENLNLNQ